MLPSNQYCVPKSVVHSLTNSFFLKIICCHTNNRMVLCPSYWLNTEVPLIRSSLLRPKKTQVINCFCRVHPKNLQFDSRSIQSVGPRVLDQLKRHQGTNYDTIKQMFFVQISRHLESRHLHETTRDSTPGLMRSRSGGVRHAIARDVHLHHYYKNHNSRQMILSEESRVI